jgi:hypothetical protein
MKTKWGMIRDIGSNRKVFSYRNICVINVCKYKIKQCAKWKRSVVLIETMKAGCRMNKISFNFIIIITIDYTGVI